MRRFCTRKQSTAQAAILKGYFFEPMLRASSIMSRPLKRKGRDIDREAKKQKLDQVKISNEKCFDNIINFIESE